MACIWRIVFAYRKLSPGCPGVADRCNFRCAEAACAPINKCCGAVVENAGVLGERSLFYQIAALVCRLVLVAQWGVGDEVVDRQEKVSWLGGG